MSEQTKNKNITFRLNDDNNEKLENLASSHDVQKSTMAANIVASALSENMEEFLINHISYSRPVTKKIFSCLSEPQVMVIISDMNEYNKGVIESSKHQYSTQQILNFLKKWFKKSGCEVSIMVIGECKVVVIHHEMELNWSKITCNTSSYILELLGNKIEKTFVEKDWFKIEYLTKQSS